MRITDVRTALLTILLVTSPAACARQTTQKEGEVQPAPAVGVSKGVTAEDLQRSPSIPIEQQLQSKVAGITVTRTEDGGIAIRIRGTSSFTGNNNPLYVVDGIPTEPGPNGGLTGVNPYDIASIKILKDASDLTMYGVRGANGVVIIKTKRPGQ